MIVLRAPSHPGQLYVGSEEHRQAWLPRLGPTTYVLVVELLAGPADRQVHELARALGVRAKKLGEALCRAEQFGHLWLAATSTAEEPIYQVATTVRHPRPRAASIKENPSQ